MTRTTQRILVGDVRSRLAELPPASVQCVVTSPPYYGLRDYGAPGQIGLESTMAEYIGALVEVFQNVHRVLRDDGVFWLNIGDSYAGSWGAQGRGGQMADRSVTLSRNQIVNHPKRASNTGTVRDQGLKAKDLMMVPARLAISLQEVGWYLRSDIIWAKKSPMPESVTDRPTSAHEHIFLLSKSKRYFYDAEAVTEIGSDDSHGGAAIQSGPKYQTVRNDQGALGVPANGTRNLRNVWHLGPEPFPQAHFATFVTEIPRRCIKAGTSEHGCCEACGAPWIRAVERTGGRDWRNDVMKPKGIPGELNGNGSYKRGQSMSPLNDTQKVTTLGWEPSCACNAGVIPCTVLDPFLGSGTTLLVADQLGRNGIGIELNPEYAEMAEKRIYGDSPMFANVERVAV